MRSTVAALGGWFLFSCALVAQGALTPPAGAPSPVMRTLDQIEPRIPVGVPGEITPHTITISGPGSFVLVGPISVASGYGIVVNADNVDLDLNGYFVASGASPAAFDGIRIAGGSNVRVRNGIVRGGFRYGVTLTNPAQTGVEFADLTVQGVAVAGFDLQGVGIVRRASVSGSPEGIVDAASVSDSHVSGSTIRGIVGQRIASSSVVANGGIGISGALVRDCTVAGSATTAIFASVASFCSVAGLPVSITHATAVH